MKTHLDPRNAGWQATYRLRLRRLFNAAYGDQCACCGMTDERFLSMGHSRGDGSEHRMRKGYRDGTVGVMLDLKKRGWPQDEGIVVECFNCNLGAARNRGVCPHKEEAS